MNTKVKGETVRVGIAELGRSGWALRAFLSWRIG